MAATSEAPSYCQVEGYVAPQVGFGIVLPDTHWNGKFIEVGCGGFCGSFDVSECMEPLKRGYACIASDMGHEGSGGLWAQNNLQAKIDWGYRGSHVTALAGKAITEHYYHQRPSRSYYSGCSTGGRIGMVEVQRFPWDFDGVVVGAPPLNFTAMSMTQLWGPLALRKEDGRSLLSKADAQLLHEAVLAQCDMDDGVKDGIVGNPLHCGFDPAKLACRVGQEKACLTQAQIQAVKKIYSGPVTSTGERIYVGGAVPGSELSWSGTLFSDDGGMGFLYSYNTDKFRYAAFSPDPGPRWTALDLDFDRDYKRLGVMESLYSATNPDLRSFKRSGGKLLVYQGWNDPFEAPRGIIDYYETVERTMGGHAQTQDFFRLFVVPGMNHCSGGEGAFAIDYLSYLETWAEKGQAPDVMIGAHVNTEDLSNGNKFPLDPARVAFTRPVYPYPIRAKYKGKGDPKNAGNFGPSEN